MAAFLVSLVEVKVLSGLREPARVNLESQPQEAQTSQSTFAEVLENKAYVSFTLKAMLSTSAG